MQLKWCRIIKLEFCVFIFGETTSFDSASSFLFFLFLFLLKWSRLRQIWQKKKHVNTMMCHLTTKTNYGVIANGTKLHGVKSNF